MVNGCWFCQLFFSRLIYWIIMVNHLFIVFMVVKHGRSAWIKTDSENQIWQFIISFRHGLMVRDPCWVFTEMQSFFWHVDWAILKTLKTWRAISGVPKPKSSQNCCKPTLIIERQGSLTIHDYKTKINHRKFLVVGPCWLILINRQSTNIVLLTLITGVEISGIKMPEVPKPGGTGNLCYGNWFLEVGYTNSCWSLMGTVSMMGNFRLGDLHIAIMDTTSNSVMYVDSKMENSNHHHNNHHRWIWPVIYFDIETIIKEPATILNITFKANN